MSQWISVNDKLPPLGVAVLAFQSYGKGRIVQVTRMKIHQDDWEYLKEPSGYVCCPRYTHWMPLPSFPELE